MSTIHAETGKAAPKRLEIAGHFVHFDDGKLKERGDYRSKAEDILKTVKLIKKSEHTKSYSHLLIYAHGGLNNPAASAKRVAALKDGFKRNGIYPFHIMYDTVWLKNLRMPCYAPSATSVLKDFFETCRIN